MDRRAREYLDKFLASLPPEDPQKPPACDAYYFCADEKSANLCADLVLKGEKRATAGLLWSYQAEDEAIPEIGNLAVITNWDGIPQCIIEITKVEIKAFNEVGPEFAFEEGEGDKSLSWWREAHWKFFSAECAALEREAVPNMPVVLEKFKVIYRD